VNEAPGQDRTAGLRIGLGVRPPRVAVGVPDVRGISWLRMFEAAIAAQTRVWGGIANWPFPLNPRFTDSDLFWALADRFDADAWATYTPSIEDMQTLDEGWFDERVASIRARHSDLQPEDLEKYLVDHLAQPAVEPHQPAEAVRHRVLTQFAPFSPASATFEFEPIGGGEPSWPLVDVAGLAGLPDITRSPTTKRGSLYRLLLTAELGRISPSFERALLRRAGFVNHHPFGSRVEIARTLFARDHEDGTFQPWPWALSEHGLAAYQRGRRTDRPVVVVVGDSAADFTLFYALRRWTSLAFWLPSVLRRSPIASRYLASAAVRFARRSTAGIAVTTSSTDIRQVEEVAQFLRDDLFTPMSVTTAHWSELLPDEPNRWFETGNYGVPRQLVPLEGSTTTELPTPLPRRTEAIDPTDMRWITDVVVDGWAPLRNPAVGSVVLDAHTPDFQRATATGAAYFCPSTLFVYGQDLETLTVRPRLRRLTLVQQLEATLNPQGWSCEYSDKGRYALETTRLFGGPHQLAAALDEGPTRDLLEGFVRGGAGIAVAGSRRSLSFPHIAELGGDDPKTLVSQLLATGVLARGLVLRCSRCLQTAWYDLGEVSAMFTCRRCRIEQSTEGRSIGDEEPSWFYELAEVVHQFIAHYGDIPVLAVERWFGTRPHIVDRAVELQFSRNVSEEQGTVQRHTELDIVVSDGPKLWLGEAALKLRPSKARLRDVMRVARVSNASGVLFATAERRFPDQTRALIESAFRGSRIEVAMLSDVRSKSPPSA
jgi:hypothetical protein